MSEEQYGLVNVYNSWSAIVSVFAVLAVSGVAFVGLNKYENDRPRFISTLQGLMTILIIAWFALYCVFNNWWENLTGLPFVFMCAMFAQCLFTNTMGLWIWKMRYENQNKQLFILTAGSAIIIPAVSILFVSLASEDLKAQAQIISTVVIQIIMYGLLYISGFVRGKKFFSRYYWKYALAFSIPLIPHQLSNIVLNSSDKIMIEQMIGREETAWYSVAYGGAMILSVFVVAYTHSIIPWYYERIKKGEYIKLQRLSNISSAAFAIIPIIIALFAPEIVQILAPESYYAAIWVIPPVAASIFFIFLYQFFVLVEYYFEKTALIATASVGCAVLNIILNLIFLPVFGFVAAAYTTLASYILFALTHYFNVRILCKKNLNGAKLYNIKRLSLVSIAIVVISIGINFTYSFPLLRYAILITIFSVVLFKRKTIIKTFKQFIKI